MTALLGLSLLVSCDVFDRETLKPQERPRGLANSGATATKAKTPSARSRALSAYYLKLEEHLVAQGLLRRDGGGPDTQFDAEDLAENFEAIAFYDEHSGGDLSGAATVSSRFHPWRGPIRLNVRHGRSVTPELRSADKAAISSYTARLSRVLGKPIQSAVSARANFHVLIMSEDDTDELRAAIRRIWPELPERQVLRLTALPRDIYCLVQTNLPLANTGEERAIAIIRAEHPPLTRLACIHEEIAQGLGLSNDSPYARPSIFNDDEEFATLTSHDELLLKMLMDPRLKSGMSINEARPIIARIAQELTGEAES